MSTDPYRALAAGILHRAIRDLSCSSVRDPARSASEVRAEAEAFLRSDGSVVAEWAGLNPHVYHQWLDSIVGAGGSMLKDRRYAPEGGRR